MLCFVGQRPKATHQPTCYLQYLHLVSLERPSRPTYELKLFCIFYLDFNMLLFIYSCCWVCKTIAVTSCLPRLCSPEPSASPNQPLQV